MDQDKELSCVRQPQRYKSTISGGGSYGALPNAEPLKPELVKRAMRLHGHLQESLSQFACLNLHGSSDAAATRAILDRFDRLFHPFARLRAGTHDGGLSAALMLPESTGRMRWKRLASARRQGFSAEPFHGRKGCLIGWPWVSHW